MKMITFESCIDCPYYDIDPATPETEFWGQEVCTFENTESGAGYILLTDSSIIPETCRLEDAKMKARMILKIAERMAILFKTMHIPHNVFLEMAENIYEYAIEEEMMKEK